ncbi:MAG: hypothetical protein ACRDHY_01940, partial [Anaerolineales bacterium]
MTVTTIEELRQPHPDQVRIDLEAARTLRRTAGALIRSDESFLHPRRGLAPAVQGLAEAADGETRR